MFLVDLKQLFDQSHRFDNVHKRTLVPFLSNGLIEFSYCRVSLFVVLSSEITLRQHQAEVTVDFKLIQVLYLDKTFSLSKISKSFLDTTVDIVYLTNKIVIPPKWLTVSFEKSLLHI